MAEDLPQLSPEPAAAGEGRLAQVLSGIARLSAGDLTTPIPLSGSGDELDQIVDALHRLAGAAAARRSAARQHLEAILEVMLSMLALDFSKKAPMMGVDEAGLDALAFGLNNISDELASSMVSRAYVDNILDSMLDPLVVLDEALTAQRINRAALQLFGHSRADWSSLPLATLLGSEALAAQMAEALRTEEPITNLEIICRSRDGRVVDMTLSASPMRDGAAIKLVCVFRDITASKHAEAAQRQNLRQEEIIRAQRAVIAELSIPLIPITDRILVLPLIGSVDAQRAQRLIETLLTGIVERRAEVVILDITGVAEVDAPVAALFLRAGQAVKLLGARFILTGIRTEVAQTLIRLGIDLSVVLTQSTLQSAIASAMSQSKNTGKTI